MKRVGSFAMRNPVSMPKAHTNYKRGKLIDLGADQCKFVLFPDHTMCGAKVHKRHMCEKHYKICWQVKQPAPRLQPSAPPPFTRTAILATVPVPMTQPSSLHGPDSVVMEEGAGDRRAFCEAA